MKVLVTASDSAVGKALISKYGRLHRFIPVEKFDFDLTDISNVIDLLKTHRPDAVVHLDEMRGELGSPDVTDRAIENYNAVCFKNIQTASKVYGVKKLIVLGSGKEYGEPVSCVREDAPIVPGAGGSHVSSKRAVSRYASGDGLTTVFRVFDMYGPDCFKDGIIMSVLASAAGRRAKRFPGNFEFSAIFVSDAAAVISHALSEDIPAGVYNLASPERLTVTEAARYAEKACYKPALVRFDSDGGAPEYTADVTKLLDFLGTDFKFTSFMLGIGKTMKCAKPSVPLRESSGEKAVPAGRVRQSSRPKTAETGKRTVNRTTR